MYGTDPNDGQNAHTSLVSFHYRSSICVINASHISLSSRHYTDKSLVCAMRLPSSRLSAVFLLIVLCPKNISVYYVICVKAISGSSKETFGRRLHLVTICLTGLLVC